MTVNYIHITNNWRLNVTLEEELILLAFSNRKLYGADVVRALGMCQGMKLPEDSRIYKRLKSMNEKGLICIEEEVYWGEGKYGTRTRKLYALTLFGKEVAENIRQYRGKLIAGEF